MIDEQINSVRRELANMVSVGIVQQDAIDNKLYYSVNEDYRISSRLQLYSQIKIQRRHGYCGRCFLERFFRKNERSKAGYYFGKISGRIKLFC